MFRRLTVSRTSAPCWSCNWGRMASPCPRQDQPADGIAAGGTADRPHPQQRGHLAVGRRTPPREIARALATSPRFILLDEPFAGVDPIAVIEIQRIVRFLKGRGIGVLITDHNVRETLGICDRAYIISEAGADRRPSRRDRRRSGRAPRLPGRALPHVTAAALGKTLRPLRFPGGPAAKALARFSRFFRDSRLFPAPFPRARVSPPPDSAIKCHELALGRLFYRRESIH